MAVVTTNLGVVTAYGDAVAAGYTGTKAEWQALMASYATVGQTAVDAKDTAVEKAAEATTASNIATQKATEAATSAQSITQSAEQIQANTENTTVNCVDYLSGKRETVTHNNVTYEWNGTSCAVSGTASGSAYSGASVYAFYNSPTVLPDWMKNGKTYRVLYSGTNVVLKVWFYKDGAYLSGYSLKSNRDIVVPDDATGFVCRLQVESGVTVNEIVSPQFLNTYTNVELANLNADLNKSKQSNIIIAVDDYTTINRTYNGITYTLSGDGNRYHVQGTASGGSFYNLWHNFTALPSGVTAGDKIFVKFTMKDRVFVRILFYAEGSTSPIANIAVELSQTIIIPSNAVGMTIRFYLNSGFSVNTDVLPPLLIPYQYRSIFATITSAPPRYISFIDDDTSSDDLVTKFYQACKHNGVTGSYAVITGRYASGTNSISLLKSYVNDGFGTILHCADQQQYLNTSNAEFDRVRAIENYMQAINDFRTLGLVNPQNAIVMPYGNYSDEAKGIAKDLGFDLAFSTRFTRCNSIYEYDRYGLYRCSLMPSAEVTDDTDATVRGTMATCKARIDELATSLDGGWLVIVTHFNTWQNESWDTTLDSNGIPIGYSRFNTLVDYAKNAGLVPISMMQGMSFIKPFLYSNEANQ